MKRNIGGIEPPGQPHSSRYHVSNYSNHCILGDYGGHGNSYHADGGRGNKRAQMRHCLRLLRSMCSTEDEAILQDLCDQGAISQITGT